MKWLHSLVHASGGPGGLVYQYIFVWIGVMLSFTIISELASMYDPLPVPY